jgi:hypothetical protein
LDDALVSVGSHRQVGDRCDSDMLDDGNPPAIVANTLPPSTSAEPPTAPPGSEAGDDVDMCQSSGSEGVHPKKSGGPKGKGKKPASRCRQPDAKASRLARELAQLAIAEGPAQIAEGKKEGATARRSTRKTRGA